MIFWIYIISSAIIGYICGSIPFALIIGKAFYNVDVRDFGSKNLGTTNVGRILGKKAAFFVLILDSFKGPLAGLLAYFLSFKFIAISEYSICFYLISCLMASVGHCFPVFADFRGGKAVAAIFGFLLFTNYKLLIIFLIIFLTIFFITKIVSLSSIFSSIGVFVFSFIPFINKINFYFKDYSLNSLFTSLTLLAIVILLVIRHFSNIKRIINKEEKQFEFRK